MSKESKKSGENTCTSNNHDDIISEDALSAENNFLKTKLQELQRQLTAALSKQPPLQTVNNLQPTMVAAENQQPDNQQPHNPQPDNPQPNNPQPEEISQNKIENDTFQLKNKTRWARGGRGRERGRGRGRGRERGRKRGNNKTIINYINM
ncbi:2-succinyl-5-enolpyruvyl-6-hydroxy-3-cyclohexene-1-carboxylate synthase [Lasius niger]|uniref:2-succinyl-5-enolpyruvyl-6-hydroxy-3-cyclohexene-1-carboxylate synthase n=1 Tax=Lasius niger TaxID=67767 RepID=A0A0J7N5R4_LASNI|nr:2-succinyl-5-enolpyruvyl-6-hydroxy-3-cyclohexene-1-carboxylate synthase [Lasius niger]